MKVTVAQISREQEEEAKLFVHEEDSRIKTLEMYLREEEFRRQTVICQKGANLCRIDSREIFYIDSVQEVQEIHTEQEVYTTRQRLYVLERALPDSFVRISKSAILNLAQVKEYKPMPGGMMAAQFRNEEVIYISRKYLKEIRERIWEGRL